MSIKCPDNTKFSKNAVVRLDDPTNINGSSVILYKDNKEFAKGKINNWISKFNIADSTFSLKTNTFLLSKKYIIKNDLFDTIQFITCGNIDFNKLHEYNQTSNPNDTDKQPNDTIGNFINSEIRLKTHPIQIPQIPQITDESNIITIFNKQYKKNDIFECKLTNLQPPNTISLLSIGEKEVIKWNLPYSVVLNNFEKKKDGGQVRRKSHKKKTRRHRRKSVRRHRNRR